ncbi:hypothetical protein HRbin12_01523 [bacterium HR12]|nr:hypothetical protein HRbin12_01523 [bacterium HR12]
MARRGAVAGPSGLRLPQTFPSPRSAAGRAVPDRTERAASSPAGPRSSRMWGRVRRLQRRHDSGCPPPEAGRGCRVRSRAGPVGPQSPGRRRPRRRPRGGHHRSAARAAPGSGARMARGRGFRQLRLTAAKQEACAAARDTWPRRGGLREGRLEPPHHRTRAERDSGPSMARADAPSVVPRAPADPRGTVEGARHRRHHRPPSTAPASGCAPCVARPRGGARDRTARGGPHPDAADRDPDVVGSPRQGASPQPDDPARHPRRSRRHARPYRGTRGMVARGLGTMEHDPAR